MIPGTIGYYTDDGEWMEAEPGSMWFSSVTLAVKYFVKNDEWAPVYPFFPWNPDHPCLLDFTEGTLEHDMKYEDTSQGDGLYFQQSGHLACSQCNHCEAYDGRYEGGDDL